MTYITNVFNKVIAGDPISQAEALAILNVPDSELMFLLAMADRIRQVFCSNVVDCCAIVNARSGRCPEDCKYCAQSGHYKTDTVVYKLRDFADLKAAALDAKKAGAKRFSLVTSGRNAGDVNEFEKLISTIKRLRDEVDIELCCSLGFVTYEQALRLKEVGITRYHSNIETAPSHFKNICTTHSFEDKLVTLNNVKKAGLRICSGGILNLGETLEQRVEMAFTLKNMGIDSIPLNILNPIKNTPLEGQKDLEPFEILKTLAMFRFVNPKAQIRLAGGRERNLRSLQAMALNGGLDGLMIGNYLTTKGQEASKDLEMITDLKRI